MKIYNYHHRSQTVLSQPWPMQSYKTRVYTICDHILIYNVLIYSNNVHINNLIVCTNIVGFREFVQRVHFQEVKKLQ